MFPSLAHVAVTVTDLERSTRWYGALFGAEAVLDEDETTGNFHHTVFLLDGGQLFGSHTHPAGQSGTDFDERVTGLDHVTAGSGPTGWAPGHATVRSPAVCRPLRAASA